MQIFNKKTAVIILSDQRGKRNTNFKINLLQMNGCVLLQLSHTLLGNTAYLLDASHVLPFLCWCITIITGQWICIKPLAGHVLCHNVTMIGSRKETFQGKNNNYINKKKKNLLVLNSLDQWCFPKVFGIRRSIFRISIFGPLLITNL